MSRVLVYARIARTDLDAIFDVIAADNPARAIGYVREIEAACEALCAMPLMGIARSDLHPGLRTFPLRRRIVIAYVLPPDRVRVLRIFVRRPGFRSDHGRALNAPGPVEHAPPRRMARPSA